MKYVAFTCVFLIFSCSPGSGRLDSVPYGESPPTPEREILEEVSRTDYDQLVITDTLISEQRTAKMHRYLGNLFNGWVRQTFQDNDHRYRYMLIDDGLVVWQVGYYDTGEIDHDFHMKNGFNMGSQRMWNKGGGLYIDTYFLEGGIQHGPQKRWYGNGQLAMDAFFRNGTPVYEVLFDTDGTVVNAKGKLPEAYQHIKE